MAVEQVSVYFTLQVNLLKDALCLLETYGVELKKIQSRPSQDFPELMDFMVRLNKTDKFEDAIKELRKQAKYLTVFQTALFPKHVSELDKFSRNLSTSARVKKDDKSLTDTDYQERRKEIAAIAENYKHGQPIPHVIYTTEEISIWNTIFERLQSLYPTHACQEFNELFLLLKKKCVYGPDSIPQMEDVSNFLRDRTGFTLRPVAGLMKIRDFLAGLAFRVFHATQHIRHITQLEYTPEPDFCHELLGHVTMFADPDFAQFSQEIGLASLGAPDEVIKKLSALYWFTVEFGLCKEGENIKAYGASLLSSIGELNNWKTHASEEKTFDPLNAAGQTLTMTKFQPFYYVADSFQSAKEKIRRFVSNIPREVNVRYDPYTKQMEVLDNKESLSKYVKELQGEVQRLATHVEHYI